MNDEVFVFDDIINLSYQLQIEDILLGERLFNNDDFPWYFIPDITYNDGLANQGRCGFAHYFADEDDGIISEFHPLFLIFYMSFELIPKTNYENRKLFRLLE